MSKLKEVSINWNDYGTWKNWCSPWGEIGFEQRPKYCDRGKYVFKLMTHGLINRFLEPLLSCAYFFDETRAMSHLYSVVKIAQTLTDNSLINLAVSDAALPINGFNNQILRCQTIELTLQPIDIPIVEFNVVVSPAHLEYFSVDYADRFPRYYLERSIATLEMKDWLVAHSQIDCDKTHKA